MDIYGTLAGLNYTPTLGDAITVTGEYYPYHQLPELEYPTAISEVASHEPVAGPRQHHDSSNEPDDRAP